MPADPAILVTVCARGGSKGVPNKNVREVGGKPLIAHTIEQAREWPRTTDLVVSTDSDEIAEVARNYGASVPFRRPAELATDEAAKLPAIRHAADSMEDETGRRYEYVVDLDATAPLRLVDDIDGCFREVYETQATNAYTVCEAEKNPYFNMVELDEDGYAGLSKELPTEVVRRQDAPAVYEMNASVYVYEREFLSETDTHHGTKTRVFEMPPERSVDIDRQIDLRWVEYLFDHPEVWT